MTSTDQPGIPRSIHLFERVQITALAVGWINAAYTYDTTLRGKVSSLIFAAVLIVVSVAVVFLIHRITRRHSSTGVWVLVAITSLFAVPWVMLMRAVGFANWTSLLLIFQGVLQVASLVLLAAPEARIWIDER
jgi:hypothetical protein